MAERVEPEYQWIVHRYMEPREAIRIIDNAEVAEKIYDTEMFDNNI